MLCSWEVNRTSGIALDRSYRLWWFFHLRAKGQFYDISRSVFAFLLYHLLVILCFIILRQGGHKPGKPGILRYFSDHGEVMEFTGNSVQPQGRLTLWSECSLSRAMHMQPSVSGARKLLI